ncbi:BgTH12-04798 [Blumeria graminis f. sp. triticale]|uniref:Exocyst complex protein EXO70 n=3 Tax=Blumeria graminis TaxID=34373 RepID=A0A061HIY2_BLUGR|nr:subunit of the exocyst complex [Blumeria graminis f. sp. tritici 96224]CAD6499146.1 BgTH12-04798 [Blumeria graminis f. sp. triticale]VCU39265.1 Bgt-4842 [Blumeria graminis f. sp. tritici]
MAGSRQSAEEEMRAEVDVLNSRLEKTRMLNKKLAASISRLDVNGKSVQEAIGPIYSDTQKLQIFGKNVDELMNAIEKVRQPSDIKGNEEDIIRKGPEQAGLPTFLNSVERMNRALADLKKTNLRSNYQAIADFTRLLRNSQQQLEGYFRKMLLEDSNAIEPLFYLTKDKPFPVISQERAARLNLIISYLTSASKVSENTGPPTSQLYSSVRGPYLIQCLQNLASATIQTLRKRSPDEIYKYGTNGISTYAKGIESAFLAEYENICALFPQDEWGKAFNATCQGSITELMRTLRDVNNHIKANITTDCFLAYEVLEVISDLSSSLENKTGELKPSFAGAVNPIRETAKSSLSELLENTRQSTVNLGNLPQDGAAVLITVDTVNRLQTMAGFLRPISSLMISIGDNGWKLNSTPAVSAEKVPTMGLFDVGADGKQIFAHYCIDTIETLLGALELKAKASYKSKATFGIFLANNAAIIERLFQTSELQSLISTRMADVEKWRKNGEALYLQSWREPAAHLFDKSYTNRLSTSNRPNSGSGTLNDSVVILKALSSKEKDGIKEKFRLFNASFDDLIAKYKAMSMERELREGLARQIRSMIEPLYGRFWDRYHEIDKGKGKYVRYDKASISNIFSSLS